MERGRDKFRRYKSVIEFISRIIKIFPKKMRMFFFFHLRNVNGKIGLVLRYATLKTLAQKIGDNVSIHPNVFIFNPENLSIGDNVSIHPMCYIEALGNINIGDDVSIAHNVTILSVNHFYRDKLKLIKDQGIENRPTTIESNVWIGAKATILGGVKVKTGNVIAAGAVVTKEFEDDVVLAGVPAKIIERR